MQALIYYSFGKSLDGNYVYKTTAKKIDAKQVDKIKVEIAEEVATTNGVQANARGVVIRNIMSL